MQTLFMNVNVASFYDCFYTVILNQSSIERIGSNKNVSGVYESPQKLRDMLRRRRFLGGLEPLKDMHWRSKE